VTADLEQRLRGAFAALETPTLLPDARRSLAPALRGRRVVRQRRLAGVALLCALAGLGGSLPFVLRSGSKPAITAAAAPAHARCVEVAVGEQAPSCEGALVALPEAAGAFAPSASQNLSAKSLAVPAPAPLSVSVGERLRVTLPPGQRWSAVSAAPGPNATSGTALGAVRIQRSAAGARLVTVVASRSGEVTLEAHGTTRMVTHRAATTGARTASAPVVSSWVLVVKVAPKS
jgi:hypothetical protein